MGFFDDLINWLLSYFNSFLDSIYNIIYWIFSPFINLFTSLLSWVSDVITDFRDLITAIGGLYGSIIHMITNIITTIFPSIWVFLIVTGIGLIFLLRIYHFLKDVEIWGFKI